MSDRKKPLYFQRKGIMTNKFWKFGNRRNVGKEKKSDFSDMEDYFFEPDPVTEVQPSGDSAAEEGNNPALTPEPVHREAWKMKKLVDLRDAFSKLADAVNKNYTERTHAELEKAREQITEVLKYIQVVAFIGSSGTGKSTRAIRVARENGISYIIDDGLLIHGGQIIAGLSAKRANSKLESVRQALFVDESRAAGMRRALAEHLPEQLMILGTSDGMLEKICANLWLSPPSRIIRIEDVSTEEERRKAVFIRSTQGQHTIPVPSMEIKHEFSGYFSDPLNRLLRRKDKYNDPNLTPADNERTVVRPTFSTLGSYSISDEAMRDIATIILKRAVPGVGELLRFQIDKQSYGVVLNMELSLVYGYKAQTVLREAQEKVSKGIEDLTSINIVLTNVKAKRLVRPVRQGS